MNEISNERWLALGLFLFIVLMVLLFAVMPLVSTGMEYHEQKQELAFRLNRSRQIVAKKHSVAAKMEQLKKEYQGRNYFSTRNTVALASADLQKLIKTSISQAGGQLTSTQVLPRKIDNGFNRVTVKVRMSGGIEVLRNVLYEIESAEQVMVVNQIDIRPVRGKRNRKTRKIEPSNKLNVNFQVASFMREEPS